MDIYLQWWKEKAPYRYFHRIRRDSLLHPPSSAMAEASKAILISSFSRALGPLYYRSSTHQYSLHTIFKKNSWGSLSICCSSSASTANDTTRVQTIPWGCDTDSIENSSDLQQWLTSKGLPQQKMAIQKVDVGERGLVALKNIRMGEKLLFVPPSLFITADSVSAW